MRSDKGHAKLQKEEEQRRGLSTGGKGQSLELPLGIAHVGKQEAKRTLTTEDPNQPLQTSEEKWVYMIPGNKTSVFPGRDMVKRDADEMARAMRPQSRAFRFGNKKSLVTFQTASVGALGESRL